MPPISTKEKDYLDQDQPIRGQNYVCLSFLSPEDAIISKDAFTVKKFMRAFSDETSKVFKDILERVQGDDENLIKNLMDRFKYVFDSDELEKEYDMYKKTYAKELTDDYDKVSDYQCSIRGIKIRGAYETIVEAQERAEKLKRQDPNFSVYVCEMGCWCPWSPYPDEIENAEYSESELNSLMKKYKENMTMRDELYEARKRELMDAHREEGSVIRGEEAGSAPELGSLPNEDSAEVTDIASMINAPAPATLSTPSI
ncbi:hypothetical protein TetV_631 [Tetraselmis virus 1]|uniref:Uncharacterized protein n=1 Tax=Tetraselmis virus 1 TaxID=2060617 RepID=A0A2P0VP79_9VIRU|nr:hypothetical protein QJ968_gp423 [Tetraselmis virus 1]AUF82713.1 hypothetical protein TetV_631 [Tetraselmis virus 1]